MKIYKRINMYLEIGISMYQVMVYLVSELALVTIELLLIFDLLKIKNR